MKRLFFKNHLNESALEEFINTLLSLLGVVLGIVALCILVVLSAKQGSTLKVVSCTIFGVSLILMYSAATAYHAARKPFWKHLFHVADHSTTYLLIAGTYTPIVLVLLDGPWGWTLFGLIWSFALFGLVFKFFFTGRFEFISTILYLTMGWLAIIAIKPLYNALPLHGLVWLAAGALFYTLGVGFFMWERLRFGHAIWHLFVLGGSLCHFFLILWYVVPAIPPS